MLNLLPGTVPAVIAILTPLFMSLPNAALGAIIVIMAIVGLIDFHGIDDRTAEQAGASAHV